MDGYCIVCILNKLRVILQVENLSAKCKNVVSAMFNINMLSWMNALHMLIVVNIVMVCINKNIVI